MPIQYINEFRFKPTTDMVADLFSFKPHRVTLERKDLKVLPAKMVPE